MSEFKVTVYISADTAEQAEAVAAERLNYEEELGFDYLIGWSGTVDSEVPA